MTDQFMFVEGFKSLAGEVYNNAKAHGWDSHGPESEKIALMHSELSEALEAVRHGNPPDDHIPEFKGTEAELADVIIRIMDISHARKWNVAEAVIAKMDYNSKRAFKHGGKAF